jgi:hypothetical protein
LGTFSKPKSLTFIYLFIVINLNFDFHIPTI